MSNADLEFESSVATRLAAYLETRSDLRGDELPRARAAAKAADKRLDQALLDLGILTESGLADLLSGEFGVPALQVSDLPRAPILPDLLPPNYLASASLLPVRSDAKTLTLAMVDPFDDFAVNAIALKSGLKVARLRMLRQQFDQAFIDCYGALPGAAKALVSATEANAESGDIELLRDAASDAPVIRFVQDALRSAVELGASDIHLRPLRGAAEMQFRVHGTLLRQTPPDSRMLPSIISRLKILANLDISERRLPQDGRIRANVAGRPVDIRLSTMPHIHGEMAHPRSRSTKRSA